MTTLVAYSHFMARYWLLWFVALLVSFLVPELLMLAKGRPQDTLSAQVWRLEQFLPGQNLWQWTALHVLIGGALAVLLLWLLLHFVLGIWR